MKWNPAQFNAIYTREATVQNTLYQWQQIYLRISFHEYIYIIYPMVIAYKEVDNLQLMKRSTTTSIICKLFLMLKMRMLRNDKLRPNEINFYKLDWNFKMSEHEPLNFP